MSAETATARVRTLDGLTIVPRRYPWRWITGAVLLLLTGLVVRDALTNRNFGWGVVWQYIRDVSILRGLGVTIMLTVICMVAGVVLGILIAAMRLSGNPVAQVVAYLYASFFRGTPVLVQLLFWFNLAALYPVISFGIPGVHLSANALISPMTAAILGLSLNEAAYMSEIIRGGVLSVDHGQTEAASALGMSHARTLRRVVFPQAMRVIVPPTGNEAITMLKTTSMVSVLAVPDLLYSSQVIYAQNFQTIPLLIVACIWYLVATAILSVGQYYLERRFARGGRRSLPPTPLQRVRAALVAHRSVEVHG
ncbi:MAG TPA: amino acid ABC transporter permease [Microbacterium sp.]|nr:amino acid ABC transporter permease [Microbacterium sp.]